MLWRLSLFYFLNLFILSRLNLILSFTLNKNTKHTRMAIKKNPQTNNITSWIIIFSDYPIEYRLWIPTITWIFTTNISKRSFYKSAPPPPSPPKKNPYTYFSEQQWLAANTYINYLINMRRIGNECMLGCVERKENTVLCIEQVFILLCVCVCGKIPDMQPFFVKLDFKKWITFLVRQSNIIFS